MSADPCRFCQCDECLCEAFDAVHDAGHACVFCCECGGACCEGGFLHLAWHKVGREYMCGGCFARIDAETDVEHHRRLVSWMQEVA